ncbi:MAG: glycosyltransferase family 4 protein [candidate division WOR-3 bacterium]
MKLKVVVNGFVLQMHYGESIIGRYLIDGLKKHEITTKTLSLNRNLRLKLIDIISPIDKNFILYKFYKRFLEKEKPNISLCFYDFDTSFIRASLELDIPTICIVHEYWPVCPLVSLYIERRGICKGPSIMKCSLHMLLMQRYKYIGMMESLLIYRKIVERIKLLNKVNSIIVPSNYVKEILMNFINNEIVVIKNGVDCKEIRPIYKVLDTKIVSYLSRWEEMKGNLHFVKLAKTLNFPNTKFICTTPIETKFVEGVGFLSRKKLIKTYQKSYVIVIPSLWGEPFGIVAIEAMAAGKPVIAYSSGGLKEIIKDNSTGFLVPPGNLQELVNKTKQILLNEDLAFTFGKNGRKLVEKCYTKDKMILNYIKYIKSVVG